MSGPPQRPEHRTITTSYGHHARAAPLDAAATAQRDEAANRHPHLYPLGNVIVWYLGAISVYLTAGALLTVDAVLGSDAHAYWSAAQGATTYDKAPGDTDAYLYSPAFLTVVRPLAMLPWPMFIGIWICIEAAVLGWLLKPLPKRWGIPIFMCCVPELTVGNINVLLAGATVLAMRSPTLWAVSFLTKVTPGIGVLWFAFRGEWRRFLHGVGGTVAVIAVFCVLDPAAFLAWAEFLLHHDEGTEDGKAGFALRCLAAVMLIALGARTRRAWLIPLGMLLASPVVFNLPALALLSSIPRLSRMAVSECSPFASASQSPTAAHKRTPSGSCTTPHSLPSECAVCLPLVELPAGVAPDTKTSRS